MSQEAFYGDRAFSDVETDEGSDKSVGNSSKLEPLKTGVSLRSARLIWLPGENSLEKNAHKMSRLGFSTNLGIPAPLLPTE